MNITPDPNDEPRRRLAHDSHRPQYHFLPPANWMNDPNGLIHWQGQYHMFYQYNPHGPLPRLMHWGHAVSPDMLHWTDLPIALTPVAGEPDQNGCWSGCTVDNGGVPTIFYTGVFPQVVCRATGSPDLMTWQKFEGNPVIAGPPAELAPNAGGNFRDPFVWEEAGVWYMVMGSRQEGAGGMVLLYRSEDLTNWEYLNPLLAGDPHQTEPFWTGAMWECPNFFKLGEQWVLITSIQDQNYQLLYPIYFTGRFQDHKFMPETQRILAYGDYFYAPLTMQDQQRRRVMWGWIREGRSQETYQAAGWSGLMSVPIILSPGSEGKLALEPAPELASLRKEHWHYEGFELSHGPETASLLDKIQGDCLEILAEFELDEASEFGFKLRCSPDGQEQTRILLSHVQQQILVERENSSLDPAANREVGRAPLELVAVKSVKLQIFLDRSVIELFVNGQTYLATRIYPTRADSLGLGLLLNQGAVKLKSLDIWTVKSVWEKE